MNPATLRTSFVVRRLGVHASIRFAIAKRLASLENLRRAAEVARLANDAGLVCVASFIAPHEDVREKAKERIGADRFFHIHLSTPLEVCRQRDQSGIYAAADRGEVTGIAGLDRQYDTPRDADLIVPLLEGDLAEVVDKVKQMILDPDHD